MFVRRSIYKLIEEFNSPEGQKKFKNALRDGLYPLDGLINSNHMPNEDGTWEAIAIWRSRAHADAARERVAAAWAEQADKIETGPEFEEGGVDLLESP